MRGRKQVHRICWLLEYILSISVLEYRQTDASHGNNQWLAHAIHLFVLEFMQSLVNTDIYMKPPNVPKDFEIPDLSNFTKNFI